MEGKIIWVIAGILLVVILVTAMGIATAQNKVTTAQSDAFSGKTQCSISGCSKDSSCGGSCGGTCAAAKTGGCGCGK